LKNIYHQSQWTGMLQSICTVSASIYIFIFFFFSHSLRDKKSKHRYANCICQYVALTGLNQEEFNKMLNGLMKVCSYFEDALPNYGIEPIEPLTIHNNIVMACYIQYFKPSCYCKTPVPYPFGPGVDPNGHLVVLTGNGFIHMENNSVQYLRKKVD
jgi:hypothetical protein